MQETPGRASTLTDEDFSDFPQHSLMAAQFLADHLEPLHRLAVMVTLPARLATLGAIVQGTITERTIAKKDPRNADSPRTIGPYYQWTFKRNAKTVTANLSASQRRSFQRAIDNNRKLETLLTQMRELSVQILNASTQGVRKRNRNK